MAWAQDHGHWRAWAGGPRHQWACVTCQTSLKTWTVCQVDLRVRDGDQVHLKAWGGWVRRPLFPGICCAVFYSRLVLAVTSWPRVLTGPVTNPKTPGTDVGYQGTMIGSIIFIIGTCSWLLTWAWRMAWGLGLCGAWGMCGGGLWAYCMYNSWMRVRSAYVSSFCSIMLSRMPW